MTSSASCAGPAAALDGPQDAVAAQVAVYRRRRDLMVSMLNEAPGLSCHRPEGAFYLWVDVRDAGTTAQDLALNLLRHHHVALVAGTAFGAEGEGWVRISLASTEEAIRVGVAALADTVGALTGRR